MVGALCSAGAMHALVHPSIRCTYPFLAYTLLAFELHMAAGHLWLCKLPGGTVRHQPQPDTRRCLHETSLSLLEKLDRNLCIGCMWTSTFSPSSFFSDLIAWLVLFCAPARLTLELVAAIIFLYVGGFCLLQPAQVACYARCRNDRISNSVSSCFPFSSIVSFFSSLFKSFANKKKICFPNRTKRLLDDSQNWIAT